MNLDDQYGLHLYIHCTLQVLSGNQISFPVIISICAWLDTQTAACTVLLYGEYTIKDASHA